MAAPACALALVARPRVGRLVARRRRASSTSVVAAVLALGASELVLRRVHLRARGVAGARRGAAPPSPMRGSAGRSCRRAPGTTPSAGASIDYAFDPAGYRVRRVDEPVDPERPTILFVGESVMFGEGLTWEESVPAQVGAMMGMQSANLAVHGFGTDQAYLRLETELPRFRRPVAVVSLFMTALFGRNLDDDRPHLGPGLVWLPAGTARAAGVARRAARAVPERRDGRTRRHDDARGAARHRRIWRARAGRRRSSSCRSSASRNRAERALRRRILDETGCAVRVGRD